MFKKIIAGILSAAIVFSSLTPAVNATEAVVVSQEETENEEMQDVIKEEIVENVEVDSEENVEESEIVEPVEEAELPEEREEEAIVVEAVAEEVIAQTLDTEMPLEEGERAVIKEGTCGDNLTWVLYDDGELVISGSGELAVKSYGAYDYPWRYYASKVTSLTVSEGITVIGDDVFADYYDYLVSVSLPDSLKTIGAQAFDACNLLENINWPKNLESIGKEAFAQCDGLTNIVFPDSLICIEEGAFYDCDGLTEITLSKNLKVLNYYVFRSCDKLKKVTIRKGLTSVSEDAFSSEYLEQVYYEGTWDEWEAIRAASDSDCGIYDYQVSTANNFLYEENPDGTLTITGVGEGGIGGKVQIPEQIDGHTVTAIGVRAFANNETIEILEIPASVKTIKKQAFYDIELKLLILHEGLESVEDYAFYSALESWNWLERKNLILPEGLLTIGKYAFANISFTYDEQIEIPASLTSIGESAFDWNEKILFKGSAQQWIDIHNTDTSKYPPTDYVTFQGDGCGFIKKISDDKSVSYELLFWSDASGDVVVPSEFRDIPVTTINSVAFKGNKTVKSVVIPECVDNMGYSVFSGCSNLESVEVNAQIDWLPNSMFSNCVSLTTVSLPHTLTSIGSSAFDQCISLEDVYYDSSLNWKNMKFSSGNAALDDAEIHFVHDWGYEITTYDYDKIIYITGKSEVTEVLEIPEEFHGIPVVGIGDRYWHEDNPPGIFQDNKIIKKVIIPDSVKNIYYNTFRGCTNLTEINFSENLTGIGSYAFAGCTSLKSIYIPKDTGLGAHVFEGCTGLERIAFAPEYKNGFWCHLFAGCTNVKEITMPNDNFSVWSGSESCGINSATWEEEVASVFEGVPRNAKVKVAKNSTPYRRMVELGFTNLTVAIVLENITLPSSVSVQLGQAKTLSVTKVPSNANDTLNLVWTSTDETIASVDENGVITGHQVGSALVTVKDLNSGKTARTTVSVSYPANVVLAVGMNPQIDDLGLQTGQSVQMQIKTAQFGTLDPELFTFTSSDDSIVTVDDQGVVTSIYDGTGAISVKITAKLNNDPLKRQVSISVKAIGIQTDQIIISAMEEDLIDDGMIISKQKVKNSDYKVQLMAQGLTDSGAGTNATFTWTSSNSKVATVDGNGCVTVKKNADGVATITATVKDLKKVKKSIEIDVRDYTPRLSTNTITLNTNTFDEAQLEFFQSYGAEITDARLEGDDRFYATYKSNVHGKQLTVGAVDVVPKGTYKVTIVTEIDGHEAHSQTLTIKVANKIPSVTVKQTAAFNLFYTDSKANVLVTGKDVVVENVILSETETFQGGTFDEETGILELSYDDRDVVLDKKAVLTIYLKDYREPITKTFNISAKETKPTLSVSRKSTKLSWLSMEGAPLQIKDGGTKEFIDWNEYSVDIVATSASHVSVDYKGTDLIIQPITDPVSGKFADGKTSHTAKLEILGPNWTKAMVVSHSISVTTAAPTIKPQAATLTVNGVFGNSAATVLVPSVLNCPEPDYEIEPVIPNDNTDKIYVKADGWNLVAGLNNPEDAPANGSYKYNIWMYVPGCDLEKPLKTTITVKVVSTLPKVTADKKSINLNRAITDEVNVKATAAKGYDVTDLLVKNAATNLLISEQIKFTFDPDTDKLNVKILDPLIEKGTYKYTLTPVVEMEGGENEANVKDIALSVKIYEGKTSAKVTASGSIDLVTRGNGITYTLTGGTNFNYDASKVMGEQAVLAGQDADRFVIESLGVNVKGQPQVLVRAKDDASFTTTETCKFNICFGIENISDGVETAELKVKPKQSTLSMTVTGDTTIYKRVGTGKIMIAVSKPIGAEIGSIEFLDTKANTVPDEAIWFELEEKDGVYYLSYNIENGSKLKDGAGYKLALGVTPKGNAENKALQTLMINLKIQR